MLPTELIRLNSSSPYVLDPLPNWLADEESLRDEGVLFGLSDAQTDGKIAQIQSFFARQAAPLIESIDQHTEQISEFNQFIDQHENRVLALRGQIDELRDSRPAQTNLIRTVVSLVLSAIMCVGIFSLIDDTLRPVFPNRWIAVGVFLAGMFNLFGRPSFFQEENTRLTGRRMLTEVGLPLAASVFVLAQALQTQSMGQAVALFVFVFFLFLLTGKGLLNTLTVLQTDLAIIQANRRLALDKTQNLPVWEAEIDRRNQEITAVRTQKWPVVAALNYTQTELTQLNTHRDWLVNLFVSEFELARSLRDRLPEQQRKLMMNYE